MGNHLKWVSKNQLTVCGHRAIVDTIKGQVVTPMHTFIYARVSTDGQTTENQLLEIERAGYEADAIYQDTISGKVPAKDRPEFGKMLDTIIRTKKPKRLVVSKLDRLGRDAIDILSSVKFLEEAGCAVRVLQLGDLDLTSSAGKLVMSTLAAVSEMERDMLVERPWVDPRSPPMIQQCKFGTNWHMESAFPKPPVIMVFQGRRSSGFETRWRLKDSGNHPRFLL